MQNQMLNNITTYTFNRFKEKILSLPYFDKTFYLANVKTFQFKMADATDNDSYYSSFSNTIYIVLDKINERKLLHELIHMATANRKSINIDCYKVGYEFSVDDKVSIKALNEGLTQLLVCKAFDGDDENNTIYPIETRIAKILAYIFGEDEIYKYFFKAQPDCFVREMITKIGDNSIATLIVKMDKLLSTMKGKGTLIYNDTCKLLLFDIQKILVDMYSKMKTEKSLDDSTFANMLITPKTSQICLKDFASDDEFNIEKYLLDRTIQK